jgi:predicted nucleotidyltransferase
MTTGVIPELPAETSAALDALRDGLRDAAGDDLVSLVLYGSAARGRYDRESSDINIVVVLRHADGATIEKIAPVLHDAERAWRVEPMIVAEQEVARLAITFPIKVLDIQRRHVVLHGADVFTGIHATREHVRLRAEQELMNLAMRLRRRFFSARRDSHALALAADDAAAPLAVNLRALLLLRGTVTDEFQPALAIYDSAAREFGLDRDVLEATKRIHKSADDRSMTAEAFGRLIDTVSRAADLAATMTDR